MPFDPRRREEFLGASKWAILENLLDFIPVPMVWLSDQKNGRTFP